MKLDHVAMYVNDLEKLKTFVKYFKAKPNEQYHNKNTDFRSYFYLLTMELDWKL